MHVTEFFGYLLILLTPGAAAALAAVLAGVFLGWSLWPTAGLALAAFVIGTGLWAVALNYTIH